MWLQKFNAAWICSSIGDVMSGRSENVPLRVKVLYCHTE